MKNMKTTQPAALSWELIPFDFGQLGRDIDFYFSLQRFRKRVKEMSELAPLGARREARRHSRKL